MSARSSQSPSRAPRGPFSRPLKVRDVPDDGLDMDVEANPEECPAIADAIGVPAVGGLTVRYRIARRAGGRLEVTGALRAKVTQVCVASLDDFDSELTQDIEMTFAPQEPTREPVRDERRRGGDRMVPETIMGTDEQQDPPDPIIDDRIDLGSIAVEFLVLALDFYPKKPGIHFNDVIIGENEEPQPSAFAALERLKDRS